MRVARQGQKCRKTDKFVGIKLVGQRKGSDGRRQFLAETWGETGSDSHRKGFNLTGCIWDDLVGYFLE